MIFQTGCRKGANTASHQEATNGAPSSPVTAPLDYLEAQGRAKQAASRVISLAEVTQAIQKFQAMEDRNPKDLNELVQQHYLQSLPTMPNGSKLEYNPQTGSARIVRVAH